MTAYEMRISDWSSDVCSSDLPRVATSSPLRSSVSPWLKMMAPAAPAAAALLAFCPNGQVPRCIKAMAPAGKPAKASDSQTQVEVLQIGRASCRERVCQYVYISVGAVLLKKKQDKH